MDTITVSRRYLSPIIAAGIGYIAWNGWLWGLWVAPLLILLWRQAAGRRQAFAVALAYYLAAGRGLWTGASVFFADPYHPASPGMGLLIWLAPSVLLAGVWAALWGRRYQPARLLAVFLLLAVPPVGVVGWAHPLTAAGVYFPGWGWLGLGLLVAAGAGLAAWGMNWRLLLPVALLSLAAHWMATPPAPSRLVALNTHLGAGRDIDSAFARLRRLQALLRTASRRSPAGTLFILPESVGDNWAINQAWYASLAAQLQQKRQGALVGAWRPVGAGYENALYGLGRLAGVVLPDRVPVPVSMWRPWAKDGAPALWWGKGVASLDGERAAYVICYEQLLVWPMLVSLSQQPQVIVAAANDWWAQGTSIGRVQRQAVAAWGQLFHLLVVDAVNA